MKALILNGSPRPQGVVVQALRTAADTLRQAGADIEWIDVYRTEFRPCTGCMQCRATNVCPLPRDAAHAVGERIRQAGLLVVGTPTYWGGMSARLKMLFERLVPVFMGESALGLPQPRQKGNVHSSSLPVRRPGLSTSSHGRAGVPSVRSVKYWVREG